MTLDLTEAQVNTIIQMADAVIRGSGVAGGTQPLRDVIDLLDHLQAAANTKRAGRAKKDKTDGR